MKRRFAFTVCILLASSAPAEEAAMVRLSGTPAEIGKTWGKTDCVRLCCSLCLLEHDPEIISPDVLSKDRDRFDQTHDQKYVDKAHRRGKVGWDVGRHVEVAPHYRRPHMMLAWTGSGRAVPKIVPRRGSIVHRSKVEMVPSGWEAGGHGKRTAGG